MQAKKRKKKTSIFLRILFVVFIVYLVYVLFSFVNIQTANAALEEEIRTMENQIINQKLYNAQLNEKTENIDVFLKEQAREKGYGFPGEEVFKEVPCN